MQQKIRTIGLRLSKLDGKSLDSLGFYGLTREIARLIAASGAAIVLLESERRRVIQSRALILDGALAGNLGHDGLGAPCEYVASGRELVIPDGLQRRFPGDPFLANSGLQAYAGVPMRTASGRVFGLVAAYFRESISDGELTLEVLRIATRRLSIELDARVGRSERASITGTWIAQRGSSLPPAGEPVGGGRLAAVGDHPFRIRW